MLGSNLPRDIRMQVALNNAAGGSSSDIDLFPSLIFKLFKLSCQCLKKPN
jgi:hypothetical protein